MKLLLLKGKRALTKAGKPKKRDFLNTPTRLFTDDGREIDGLVSVEWLLEPRYLSIGYSYIGEEPKGDYVLDVREITIKLSCPDVQVITEPPLQIRTD